MIKLPYRNIIKTTKKWTLDDYIEYQNELNYKPSGLWYEIKEGAFNWAVLTWGDHIYKLEVKTKNICKIKNYDDLLKFNNKYKGKITNREDLLEYPEGKKHTLINWEKVSKDYDGFEITKYNKIKDCIKKNFPYPKDFYKFSWFFTIDFNSGCIWNLDAVKKVEYWGKLSKKEIESLEL